MKAYGPGTEVPIKSLLGHRSQAPPEVRHISGQHVKEFKEFLAKFPDDFVIREEDDVIYLKEDEGKVRERERECSVSSALPKCISMFRSEGKQTSCVGTLVKVESQP